MTNPPRDQDYEPECISVGGLAVDLGLYSKDANEFHNDVCAIIGRAIKQQHTQTRCAAGDGAAFALEELGLLDPINPSSLKDRVVGLQKCKELSDRKLELLRADLLEYFYVLLKITLPYMSPVSLRKARCGEIILFPDHIQFCYDDYVCPGFPEIRGMRLRLSYEELALTPEELEHKRSLSKDEKKSA